MSKADVNKEAYMREFRQRLYASEAFHQMLVMMLEKERVAQDLLWDHYSRQTSRSLLKRLSTRVTTWLHSQRKVKPHVDMTTTVETGSEPPWTIDAFYVVDENGTVSEVSSSAKE